MNKYISQLQYITQEHPEYSHSEQARIMFESGVDWVQIRMKNTGSRQIEEESAKALKYAKEYNCKLIINDSVDIAGKIKAHGVHLGLKDTSIAEARKQLGDNYIIGGTANTVDDVVYHVESGADYVGVGPFRFTETKKNLSPVLGVNGYKELISSLKKYNFNVPLIAVGSVDISDIKELSELGIYGVAISSALLKAKILNKIQTK